MIELHETDRPRRRRFAASAALGCAFLSAANAGATWAEPLTAPKQWFNAPGTTNPACPGGGWAELHDFFLPDLPPDPPPTINTMPIFCPRSFDDFTANHFHGAMHATGFLHSDNGFFGIFDENGNVYGSSDIAIRLDPTNFFANQNHDQGFVDMWIYRNPRGLIVRNHHDVRNFSGPEHGMCTGVWENPKSSAIANEFKTARHVNDTCAPPALRRAKEPAVATKYNGLGTETYVAWLERDQPKVNTPAASLGPFEKSWKVYVAAVPHVDLGSQRADPRFLTGGLSHGGALNRDPLLDAHSPKVAVVAGTPWVTWAEDNGANRETHVKAWDGTSWVNKGSVNTGDLKNCYATTSGPYNSFFPSSTGYSVDIASVPTFIGGEKAVIVSASEVSGECRLVVRMFHNNAWIQIGAPGAQYPGQASGLVGNGAPAMTPRIFGTPSGDVFVTWQEGGTIRAATANVAFGAAVAWKDLAGPHPAGHWGEGSFPSLAVTPFEPNGTQWQILNVASKKATTTVSVDAGLIGMVNNSSGFAQKTLYTAVGADARVTQDGKGKDMLNPLAWEAPTNLVVATNGQTGSLDNYLIWIQQAENHRTQDTGVFIRRGN